MQQPPFLFKMAAVYFIHLDKVSYSAFMLSSSKKIQSTQTHERLIVAHEYQDLIQIFDDTFYGQFNTRLVKGDDEPIYLPANEQVSYHQIIFAHGFFSSALHEIAHWCVAGPKRRLQEDFGYWYLPDGRNAEQQAKFESAEIKPQAIEWALSMACNKKFDVSVDNLNGEGESDRIAFRTRVFEQVKIYFQQGFPAQAEQLIQSLCQFYHVQFPLTFGMFETQQAQFMQEYEAVV